MVLRIILSFLDQNLYILFFFLLYFLFFKGKYLLELSIFFVLRFFLGLIFFYYWHSSKSFSSRYFLLTVVFGLILASCGIFFFSRWLSRFLKIRRCLCLSALMGIVVIYSSIEMLHEALLPKKTYLYSLKDDIIEISQNKVDALVYPDDTRFQTNDKLFFLPYNKHRPFAVNSVCVLQASLNHEHVFFAKDFPSQRIADDFKCDFLSLKKSYPAGSRSIYNIYEVAFQERPEIICTNKVYSLGMDGIFLPVQDTESINYFKSHNISMDLFSKFTLPYPWGVNKTLSWSNNCFPVNSFKDNRTWHIQVSAPVSLTLRENISNGVPLFSCFKIVAESGSSRVSTLQPFIVRDDYYYLFPVETISEKKEYVFPILNQNRDGAFWGILVNGDIKIYSFSIYECEDFSRFLIDF